MGQVVALLGWGARDDVESPKHAAYLLHSTGCPEGPGVSHLLRADSAALARSSLPRERPRSPCVLPSLPSHTLQQAALCT